MPTHAPPRSLTLRPHTQDSLGELIGAGRTHWRWIMPSLLFLVAGLLFALQLGHSSLFIDEVYSWRASRGSFGDMADALRFTEVTPPLYYLILHGWMQIAGGDTEALLRLPSVVAGVGLVAAVYWLGHLVGGRTAGLIAAGLTTISPIVLLYSQQVRAYVWVMLALTIAVAAAIHAGRGRSWRWLLAAALASVSAVLLHYTALLVLAPLAVWLWRQPEIDARRRAVFAGAIGVTLAALVPLALTQLAQGHHGATELYASLTTFNALRLVGTPFDGRATDALMLWREIGAVVVIDALALLALSELFRAMIAHRLIVACGALPILVVCAVTVLGQPMALTRYSAVAAPFILVAIGVVAAHTQRALATALVAGAIVASGAALFAAQRDHGQNPDTRAALASVAAGWGDGDVALSVGLLGFDGALSYYSEKLLAPEARDLPAFATLGEALDTPQVIDAADAGKRLWLIADPPISTTRLRATLAPLGYRPASARVFDGNAPVQLIRAERSSAG